MGRTKKVGPTRGLGTRYGVTVRKRYSKIFSQMKAAHACPQCGFQRVRRESVGVWKCRKCGFTFTGGAYTPATKLGTISRRVVRGGAPPEEAKRTIEEKTTEEELE